MHRSASAITPMQTYLSEKLQSDEKRMFMHGGNMNIIFDDPARGRTRPEAKPYADRDRTGCGVASILKLDDDLEVSGTQIQALSAASRSRKSRTKNFIVGNKHNIEKLQLNVQSEKEKQAEAALPIPFWKSEKYKDVKAKVQHRSQSTGRIKNVEPINNNDEEKPKDEEHKRPATAQPLAGTSQNFIRRNISSAGQQRIRRSPSASTIEKFQRKKEQIFLKYHKPGAIPKYLETMKEEWKKNSEISGGKEVSACPPGHSLLPNEERVKTLEKLQLAEKEVTAKLNSLPIRSDTLFLQRKKAYLQKQLEEIEEAIKIFSRPKVFVRNDES